MNSLEVKISIVVGVIVIGYVLLSIFNASTNYGAEPTDRVAESLKRVGQDTILCGQLTGRTAQPSSNSNENSDTLSGLEELRVARAISEDSTIDLLSTSESQPKTQATQVSFTEGGPTDEILVDALQLLKRNEPPAGSKELATIDLGELQGDLESEIQGDLETVLPKVKLQAPKRNIDAFPTPAAPSKLASVTDKNDRELTDTEQDLSAITAPFFVNSDLVLFSDPVDLVMLRSTSDRHVVRFTSTTISDSDFSSSDSDNVPDTTEKFWPVSELLNQELDYLAKFEITSKWAEQTRELLDELAMISVDRPEYASSVIRKIGLSINDVESIIRSIPRSNLRSREWQELYSAISRTKLRLQRRYMLWATINNHILKEGGRTENQLSASAVLNAIQISTNNLSASTGDPAWNDFLLLDKVEKVFAEDKYKDVHREAIARKILARATSPSLTESQYQFVRQVMGEDLIEQLQDAATSPVDYGQLLSEIEEFEADPHGANAYSFNSQYLNLYFSRQAESRVLADTIDTVYRNANIRIAISDDMINRSIPQMPATREPVTDRILGAQVFGNNHIQNRLHVKLQPNEENLYLKLLTSGNVFSRTRAHASGFIFHNTNQSNFQGASDIVVSKTGVTANSAKVHASTQQNLVGIRSNFDNIPIFGWAARSIAEKQQRSQAPTAKRLVEEKLVNLTRSRVDKELAQKLGEAQALFMQRILQPLNALELEPTAIGLRTTPNEVQIRCRLASRDQMSAFTARPLELPQNLLNIQIHDSAINNVLNKLDINGKKFTAREFAAYVSDLMASSDGTLPIEIPEKHNAKFTFASRDALHITFEDNVVKVSLNLKRLTLGTSSQWKNFSVHAWYIPQFEGQNIQFVLDVEKGISVAGDRLSIADQIALRTIFNSIFPEIRSLPPISQTLPQHVPSHDLVVSQLVFSHGWMGLSIHSMNHPSRNQYRQQPRQSSLLDRLNSWR